MIKQISSDEFGRIEKNLESFEEKMGPSPFPQPISFKDQMKNALELEQIAVFAKFEKEIPIGIVILSVANSRISILHVEESVDNIEKIERELFDYGFEYLAQSNSTIRIGGRSLGTTLEGYPETKGFRRFDRKHMTLSRKKIEALPNPELPEGYSFSTYDESMRDEIAGIVFESNVGSIDVEVFPEFFGSLEVSIRLLENIEQNRYGKYQHPHSKILHHNGKSIGACFLTATAEDTGYVPDICILQDYRGNGFGKAILVYSLKEMMRLEPKLVKNNLDVTISNPARFLYESLGYEDVNHYSMYSWEKS